MRTLFAIVFLLLQHISWSQLSNRSVTVNPCMKPFYHGVASGDPLTDRVILWTRVTPDSSYTGPVAVSWRVATDTTMSNIVLNGSLMTDATVDYTVKVDAVGLNPDTWYYYEFSALGFNSVRGRTRTTPAGVTDSLRFAITSCANYEAGFFNVYRVIKERNDIDAVLALGDYIYEYESGGYAPNATANRQWTPVNEITQLTDYRTRYSHYHLDEDLIRLHQQYPFVIIWDDHESANDSWMNGAENHQPNEGSWAQRKAWSKQAFFEWLPVRVTGTNDPYQIYRTIRFGNLVDLIMLDTRLHGREEQNGTTGSTVTDPNRQLLGTDQFSWLGNRLDSSSCQWKILGQQVMIAPLEIFGVAVNGDQWDGYPAERNRVMDHILNYNVKDVVAITGDIHSSWANDIPTSSYNSSNGAGSAFVEFVTPGVTSPGINLPLGAPAIQAANGHIKYADLSQHGFIIMDVNQQRIQADWYYVSTIDQSSSSYSYGASYYVNHLERFLHSASAIALPRAGLTDNIQAPECPRAVSVFPTGISVSEKSPLVLGLYPNPVSDILSVHFYLPQEENCSIKVYALDGQLVYSENLGQIMKGDNLHTIALPALQQGVYFLSFESQSGTVRLKFVVTK